MSAPETGGTHVLVQQTDMAMTDTYHVTSPHADDPHPRPPRPVTIEDVPDDDDDKGHDPAQTMTAFRAESPPSELMTPPASVSSGTPRTTGATVDSASELAHGPDERFNAMYGSPPLQPQVIANAPPPRQLQPHQQPHHHPHQQQLHHPHATQPEVFRYLDTEPPNAIPGPIQRPFRRGGQGPPSSVGSDQAAPVVLLSPSVPHARGNFPNERFALAHARPPPSEVNNWGPPEYWPEGGQPVPFQGQVSPTFPPAPMRQNGANRFPHDMPFRGPEGRGDPGPKHFQPAIHAPQRPHPRQRPPPSEFDQPRSPPFSPAVQDAGPGDMTGYKYLTSKLSGTLFGQPITPIYRRFEVMGHRILLQLQDELCQLEDSLNQLDSLETSSRYVHGNLMPASSRLPEGEDHPVAKQRLEVVSEISEKLDMYCTCRDHSTFPVTRLTRITDQFLKIFKDAQCLSRPAINEIDDYRRFLNHAHIVDEETRFLGKTEDLLSLPPTDPSFIGLPPARLTPRDSQTSTPTPGATSHRGPLAPASPLAAHAPHAERSQRSREPSPQMPIHFAYGVLVAVMVPVMTFPVFPGFAERLIIIALVFAGVGWAMWQAGVSETRRPLDAVLCAGAYVMMMAMAARVCH